MAVRTATERAALAFSALPARGATRVAERLSMTERVRLREGLARVRGADPEERNAALAALVAAVRAGVTFPPPLSHDEERCPFREFERLDASLLAGTLSRFASSQPIVAAVALCHFTPEARERLWDQLTPRVRSAIRPSLLHVPAVAHSRTRLYAKEFEAQLRRGERLVR